MRIRRYVMFVISSVPLVCMYYLHVSKATTNNRKSGAESVRGYETIVVSGSSSGNLEGME